MKTFMILERELQSRQEVPQVHCQVEDKLDFLGGHGTLTQEVQKVSQVR